MPKAERRAASASWRRLNAVMPWARLTALIAPHYPKGTGGHPAMPLERMLRVYFMQQWFNLSDPQAEDALYDIEPMRRFAGIELAEDAIPDESTILRFRHLLEKHPLTQKIFAEVRLLPASGVTTSQRRTRSIGAGRRTLPWVTNDVALSRISNSSTATAGAPSTTITANLINIDNSISSGWKRAPVVTSKSRSAW